MQSSGSSPSMQDAAAEWVEYKCTIAPAWGTLLIHRAVQERLLRGSVAPFMLISRVESGQARRVEAAERGVGRGEQPAALHPHADVAAAADGQPALEEGAGDVANRLAQAVLLRMRDDGGAHGSRSQALKKKSGVPKFPDFRASASGWPPSLGSVTVHGTPGSISGPIRSPLTPSALTTAPEVSPPATIICPTPSWASPCATAANAFSTRAPARSTPRSA